MIACPVCEHQQASGAECEVCGKRFAPGSVPVDVVAPMEGLETTGLAPAGLDPGPIETIAELEATRAAPVDVQEDVTPGVEATRAAPVDAPPGEAVPDLERVHAELPGDAPTALPLAPVCRYCRTPAVPGERLCSRCGMRLPVIDVATVPPGTEGLHLCTNCGTMTTRELCPACGNRLTPVALE
jgi:hypothetical protein